MMTKTTLISAIGTLIEWADFTFYAYLAFHFSALFFPHTSQSIALFVVFGTFAVSYVARPLGSVFFGVLGDRLGRKIAFSLTVLLMGVATGLMGCLPTYESIGNLAPCLLVLLRFLQGFAVSSEITGAGIFAIESHPEKGYVISSWISAMSACGMIVGALSAALISFAFMPPWAWRIPFLFGSVACVFAYVIRQQTLETPDYLALKETNAIVISPLRALFRDHRVAFFNTFVLLSFIGVYIYVCNIWWISFAISHQYFSASEAKWLAVFANSTVAVFMIITGRCAQHQQSTRLMRWGLMLAVIFAPCLFWVTTFGNIALMLMMMGCYALIDALVTATLFKYLVDLFPAEVRFTGAALGWNAAMALFGGTAPMLAQMLSLHSLLAPGFYVSIMAFLAYIGSLGMDKAPFLCKNRPYITTK